MEKLIIASSNKHKVEEIKQMLGSRFDIISMRETGFNEEIEETGKTFFENALIKAKTVAERLNKLVLADDSGLSVYALDGAPGVYSARYAGEKATDSENNLKLLKELEDKVDRGAEFKCCLVLYYPGGRYITGNGIVKGEIIKEAKGDSGFGYDPLFYSIELKKTFAQACSDEKNKVSHRYRALKDLKEKLNI